jgi:hypothetical protein
MILVRNYNAKKFLLSKGVFCFFVLCFFTPLSPAIKKIGELLENR